MTRLLSLVCFFFNWYAICSSHLFSYWTHSHLCNYPMFIHPICILLVGNDFAHFLSCQTTGIFLSCLWSHNYFTYPFLNHRNSTFFMILRLYKTCFILFISFITSIIIFILCDTFIITLFWFKFHFTYNVHCFLECFRISIVVNCLLNW